MKTLAKVAIGVAVAKGVSGMMKQSGGSQTATPGQTGDGGLFGGVHSPNRQAQAQTGGGLEDMLGSVLGGGSSAGQGGGLGGLLEQLSNGQAAGGTRTSGGGLNDLLGGLAGAAQQGGTQGGLGGILGSLANAAQQGGGGAGGGLGGLLGGLMGGARQGGAQGGFGDMLNQAIARQDEPEVAPSADQEIVAALMLRAMIQAMKSDGEIDRAEEQKLLGRLGDVSHEEQAFVQAEMRKPVDVQKLAREVPRGLEKQVYAMSVMGIDLDSQNEARYLHDLATALGIQKQAINLIHDQLGVPRIYA
ncbi:DUF533 domain-containing protein [Roseovarius litorisediminis]|nr:DUF533 domain-containing protein [Roseovarius litorisediminis]